MVEQTPEEEFDEQEERDFVGSELFEEDMGITDQRRNAPKCNQEVEVDRRIDLAVFRLRRPQEMLPKAERML